MPKSKPLILEPLGLIVDPSKLGQYPDGAMLVDIGIVHNGAGSHEAAPKFVDDQIIPADGATKCEVIPTPGYTLVLAKFPAGWRYSWIDDDGNASLWTAAEHAYAPLPAGASFEIDGRVSYIIARDRVFVTTDTGPMVFDYLRPQNAAERAPRLAGMFAPAIIANPVTGPGAAAIKDGEQAHLVAVITRHFPDCYEVTGPPSAAVQVAAINLDVNVQVQVLQRPGHPQYIAGDMVEVYRTYQSHRPKNESTPDEYDQGTSTTSQYFLSSVFTCPDESNAHTWVEATGDQNLGEALYTNDTVVGASSQKRPPPIARVIEEYRGYTFYFDITEPPARVARAAAGMGELTDDYSQTWGIGTRPGPSYDEVEIDGQTFQLRNADDLASQVLSNVDDLARVNPDTPGEKTTPATGFAFRFDYAGYGDFEIRASNGQNYQPPLPTLSEDPELVTRPRRKNGMMWTENGQPEAVVAAGLVGKGQVYGACATSQAMCIWTEYGIHLLRGTGGSSSAGFDWSLDQIDTQVLLRGPKAYTKLGDLTLCASNNGAVVIDAGGNVREISTAALGDIGKAEWNENDNTRLVADEVTGDVYFCFAETAFPYVYSTRWNKWSRVRVATNFVHAGAGNLQQKILFAEFVANNLILRKKSLTVKQESIVRTQMLFDGDPSSLKVWSEIEWYFDGSCVGHPVKFICNEMDHIERDLDGYDGNDIPTFIQPNIDPAIQATGEDFQLAQTWMEIDKDAPRVNNSITVGYVTPEGECAYKFYGCSITCIHLTTTIRRAKGT
jgi:hypothetical protein